MTDGRTKNSIRNITGAVMNKAVGIIFPFLIRTIIIYKMGTEYAGLSSLFTSILQILSLSELGVGSAIVYSMYKPVAAGNIGEINALLNLYRKFYRQVGGFILVAGIILMPFVPYLINGSYPADINLYALYMIYLFNTVASYFLYAYKSSVLNVYQRKDIESNIETAVNVVMYCIQIMVLVLFTNYYIYIIFLPIATVVMNLLRSAVVDRNYPMIHCEGQISKDTQKGIIMRVGALIGHKLSGVVNCSLDNVVVSAFLGLTMVAQYGNYYYVVSALSGVMSVVFSAITASIGDSIIKENVEKNKKDFYDIQYMNCWVVGWICTCMFCLYQDFITLWVGESLLFSLDIAALFVVYFYAWHIRRTVIIYKDATGLWWADKFKPYVSIGVNLILNFSTVRIWGVYGILISTIIAYLVIEGPWETIVLFREVFKCSSRKYWMNLVGYTGIVLICLAVTYWAGRFVVWGGIKGFIMKTALCGIIPNVVWCFLTFMTSGWKRITYILRNR